MTADAVTHRADDSPIFVLESEPLAGVIQFAGPGTEDPHPIWNLVSSSHLLRAIAAKHNPLECIKECEPRVLGGKIGELEIGAPGQTPVPNIKGGRGVVQDLD